MLPEDDGRGRRRGDARKKIVRLIDALEDNDDVQDVYANFDIPEQVLEAVAGEPKPARTGQRGSAGR